MCTLARKLALAATSLVLAASALGATTIGNTSLDDVTLDGFDADAFVFTPGWDPHAGPGGDTSGFGSAFDSYGSGTWTLLDRLDMSAGFGNTGVLQFTFAMASATAGTWSVHNTGPANMMLDLVFAMHAGDGGAGFLFDNQGINAGQTLNGTWRQSASSAGLFQPCPVCARYLGRAGTASVCAAAGGPCPGGRCGTLAQAPLTSSSLLRAVEIAKQLH
jgi:hypothetical protein